MELMMIASIWFDGSDWLSWNSWYWGGLSCHVCWLPPGNAWNIWCFSWYCWNGWYFSLPMHRTVAVGACNRMSSMSLHCHAKEIIIRPWPHTLSPLTPKPPISSKTKGPRADTKMLHIFHPAQNSTANISLGWNINWLCRNHLTTTGSFTTSVRK